MNTVTRHILKKRSLLLVVIAVLWMTLRIASAPIAYAGTFTVAKTEDTNDGVCDTDCSLREAIRAANAWAGDDIIMLPSGTYALTIAGTGEDAAATGNLDITGNLTVTVTGASNAVIKGSNGWSDRVLHIIGASTEVSISSVAIQNGNVPSSGGGILNDGVLAISNSTIGYNTAGVYYDASTGGGIYNAGTLLVTDSTINNNTSFCGGGGIESNGILTVTNSIVSSNTTHDCIGGAGGGGIDGKNMTIVNTAIISNTSDLGGGLQGWGTMNLSGSIVSGNIAYAGGGVLNQNGALTIAYSTISDNRATWAGVDGTGGGILNNGSLTMTNSTVSGNSAIASGGGIEVFLTHAVSLNNVTIANNTTAIGDGGGIYNPSGTVTFENSIVAGNTDAGGQAPDCYGTVTSKGYNLIQNIIGCTITGTTSGNITGASANLGPLQDNGGITPTHALLPGSPVVDRIPDGTNGCIAGTSIDQRGAVRAAGTGQSGVACDIGAYELLTQALTLNAAITTPGVEATLSWNALPVSKYQVWRSASPYSGFILLQDELTATSLVVTISPNTNYYYEVHAVGAFGGDPLAVSLPIGVFSFGLVPGS